VWWEDGHLALHHTPTRCAELSAARARIAVEALERVDRKGYEMGDMSTLFDEVLEIARAALAALGTTTGGKR